MEANNKMDEMVYQFISHISDNIITEFITKTFYHDIITNQEIYFKDENGQVTDGKIMLSTKNMSFRFILLWRQFITCNPLYKTSVAVIQKYLQKINALVQLSETSISNIMLSVMNNNVFTLRFNVDGKEMHINILIDIDFWDVMNEINETFKAA